MSKLNLFHFTFQMPGYFHENSKAFWMYYETSWNQPGTYLKDNMKLVLRSERSSGKKGIGSLSGNYLIFFWKKSHKSYKNGIIYQILEMRLR